METNKIKEFATQVRGYLDLQLEILRLESVSKISGSGASIITSAVISLFALVATVFLSLAAGFYLSALWSSKVLGFSVVGGSYLLVTFILLFFRRRLLSHPIQNKIIKELLKDKVN